MISWKKNVLWIKSLSSWEGVSFLDYAAAYKAMVDKRQCDDWVKVVDLSEFMSSKRDLGILKTEKTQKQIGDLTWWSFRNGMVLQIVVVGTQVNPQAMQDLAQVYIPHVGRTEFVGSVEEACVVISDLEVAV